MRTTLRVVIPLAALVIVFGSVMYVRNPAPGAATISDSEAFNPSKPFVVKLYARWCPVCMSTKSVWSQIEASYATRAHLVVFDFTNQTTTDASRAEAKRLGLETFFNDNSGWTGTIAVLDARTKQETATIHGSRNFADYRTAIDAALKQTEGQQP